MKSTKIVSELRFKSGKLVNVLTFFAVLILNLSPLNATTYYVSLSGNDENTGTSEGSAWRHIAYGTQLVRAGDTLLILSGNYGNDQAEIANSGTAGSPIVIIAETPGEVVMQGTGGGTGIQIEGDSYIVIEGIKFTNFGAGVNIYHSGSYITVRKCAFISNNNGGFTTWGTSSDISKCHHILAEYNHFADYTSDKQDYGIYFCYAMHCVARNNYFFGWHHQALSFKRKVHYGLAKDNVFEGFRYSAVYLGQNLDDPNDQRSRYLIAEGNTFSPAEGYRAKTPIWIANVDRAVARNNFMEGKNDVDGGWGQGFAIGDPAYSEDTRTANPAHVNIYNNVIRTIGGANTSNPGLRLMHICHDVRVFNNSFHGCKYNLGFLVEDTILFQNNIFSDTQVRMMNEGTAEKGIFEYNDIYPYWSGSGATDISVDPLCAGPFDAITLPVENPRFVPDYSRAEVCQLQESSPCIDAGAHLTKTTGSGTGNDVIEVEDAGYFTDGFGLSDGDLIQVGDNNPVRITGIDYTGNMITVAQSISWNNSDSVSMVYAGLRPDIGYYEYVTTGAIAGTVTDKSTGDPIQGATVTDGTRSQDTDASGNYRLENVPVNHTYTVTATESDYYSLSVDSVAVTEDNTTTVDFQLTEVPTGTISGTVTDSITGNPIKGAMVSDGTRSDVTDAGGNYILTDVPVDTFIVTVLMSDYIPLSIDSVVITEDDTSTVDFQLTKIPTGTISGTVTDNSTGNPIQGATVSDGTRSGSTDADGNYIIENVYVDTYSVTASKYGYLPLSTDSVVVTENDTNTVDFQLTEASDLVGYWAFEESSDTIVVDSSVNHNDGVIYGPTSTSGKLNLGFQFDGLDDYMTIPKSSSLDGITKAITLIAWVKIPSTSRHCILSKWIYGDGDERSFEFDVENGKVWFGLSPDGTNDGTKFLNSDNKITSNTWTHVAATSDGSTMKIYINGILDPNTRSSPVSIYPSAADVQIGGWMVGPNDWYYPFDGSMDEVKIYNRALSAQEITDDYSLTEPTGAISGTVTDNSTANPIQGAIVSDGTRSDTTDAGGNYTIENVPVNSYTVTSTMSGYYTLSIDNVVVTEDNTTTVDIMLSEEQYGSISGTVTDISTGLAIQDATVSDGTRSDTADADGNYILSDVPVIETYTVTASASGYLPLSIDNIAVIANDTITVDFLLTELSDLIAFWAFEESSGTIAYDSSIYNNDGIIYGPTSTSGRLGLAFQFDGTNDYIAIPKSIWLDRITDEITLISWVKMPVDSRQTILERWYPATNNRSYILDVDAGKVNFGLCGDGTLSDEAWLTSSGMISSDTWTHVAATSDGSTMKVYLNSVLDANTATPPSSVFSPSSSAIHIGRWEFVASMWKNPFNGIMDEVKIYNRALTEQEITDDYNLAPPVGINNLVLEDGLLQAYPNPFNYSTTISYKTAVAGKVIISIYNLSGQKIQTLVNETQQADNYSVVWDRTNARGGSVGSGIYYCTLNIDNKPIATKKLMLLK